MRTSSLRHSKNWKPSPASDFAHHPYMLMNLGQRDEPSDAGIPDITLTAGDFEAFLFNLKSMGFPSQEITLFHEMGFTQAGHRRYLNQVLGSSFTDILGSLYQLFSEA